MPGIRDRVLADLALLAVCVVWGSTFVVVKAAVAAVPSMTFLSLRFLLAAAVLVLTFRRDIVAEWPRLARPAAVVGFSLFAGFALQTVGLEYTQASRAGFITGLSVVLVPVLSALIIKERPSRAALAGVGLALAGLVFLFVLPNLGPAAVPLPARDESRMIGDLLVLGSAAAFATHITLVGLYAGSVARTYRQAGAFAALQVAVAAVCYLAVTSVKGLAWGWRGLLGRTDAPGLDPGPFPAWVWGAVVMTGLLATAGAFLAQAVAQRLTSPTHTALIFATEPVFAAVFGWLLLNERLGLWACLGCFLILAGMLVPELFGLSRPERE